MSPEYIILVLDEGSQKIISNFCTTFDLMEKGNIYQMELIHKMRKRYPMSDVLYFLQPTKKSIDILIEDFKENDEFDFDQYGIVHLCFTTAVPKPLFERLSSAPKLLGKLRTLFEINVNYQVWQQNIFKTPLKAKKLTQILSADRHSPIVENLAEQIYTLCSSLKERPYIQYQGDSDVCEQVATAIYNKLEQLYNRNDSKKRGQKSAQYEIQYREPRGILLITDRTLDLVSPLIHDYHYQSAVFDYLKVPENGSLEKIIPHQKSKQRQAASENEHFINEQDQIWNKFKYYHLAEVSQFMNDEIKQLREQQAHISKLSKRDNLQHDDIQNLLKQLPEFELRSAKVLIHYDLIQKVTQYISSEGTQLMRVVELEQTVLSGLDDSGKEVHETTIGKELVKIIKKLSNPIDIVRLLGIYIGCYNLPDSDYKTCLKMCNTKEEMEVLKTINSLLGNENPKKIHRARPVLPQSEFQEYRRLYINEIQEQYDILRTQPEIYRLVKDAMTKNLDPKYFPFIGEAPILASNRNVNWHRQGDDDQEGRIIVFMIGGISHYEICCLQNLEKSLGSSRLVIGSNEILTARNFCNTISNLEQRERAHKYAEDEEYEEDEDEYDRRQRELKQKRGVGVQKRRQVEDEEDIRRINDSDDDLERGRGRGHGGRRDEEEKEKKGFINKFANFRKSKKKDEIDVTVEQEKRKPHKGVKKQGYESYGEEDEYKNKKKMTRERTKPRGIFDIEQEVEDQEVSMGKRPRRRLDKESEDVTDRSYLD